MTCKHNELLAVPFDGEDAKPRAACLCGELCRCPCHCGDRASHPLPCCGDGSGLHYLYCIDQFLTREGF